MPAPRAPIATVIVPCKAGSHRWYEAHDVDGYRLTTFRTRKEADAWQYQAERSRLAEIEALPRLARYRLDAVQAYLAARARRAAQERAERGTQLDIFA